MSNIWRSLDSHLIKRQIELDLSQSINCIISEVSRTPQKDGYNPVNATETTRAKFRIKSAKLCVSVVTLYINDNIKFLENKK